MSINEESRQVEIADLLAKTARSLAHSTRGVPRPSDSYALIASLVEAQESLAQVYLQLAAWHNFAAPGIQYSGEDGPVDIAAGRLGDASDEATGAAERLRLAHSANGRVRWFDEVSTVGRAIAAEVEMENHNGEEVN